MRFSPNTGSMQSDPLYWWKEADGCFRIVHLLINEDDMAARQTVCDKCHGMLERAAKAILSEKGALGDERSHNIRKLLKRAGELDGLDALQRSFISDIANLHIAANYPDEAEERRVWYTDESYRHLVLMSLIIYTQLLSRKGTYGQGGSDGSNRGR